MLGRSLPQSAMLAERLFSGALAETLAQACGGSGTASGAARWSLSSQGLLLLRSVKGCFSTAAADAAGALSIHPSAAARLKELQAEKADSPLYLRIEVEGGGCSGFQYKFNLDGQLQKDDVLFEKDGGKVVCDTMSLEFLRGATLEFEDTLMRSAFSVTSNPNAEASCGCGSSFAAKNK